MRTPGRMQQLFRTRHASLRIARLRDSQRPFAAQCRNGSQHRDAGPCPARLSCLSWTASLPGKKIFAHEVALVSSSAAEAWDYAWGPREASRTTHVIPLRDRCLGLGWRPSASVSVSVFRPVHSVVHVRLNRQEVMHTGIVEPCEFRHTVSRSAAVGDAPYRSATVEFDRRIILRLTGRVGLTCYRPNSESGHSGPA